MNVTKLFQVSLLALCLSASASSYAQGSTAAAYPVKSVRLLVGFAPGGGTDSAARTVAVKLSELLGQTVVVDNHD